MSLKSYDLIAGISLPRYIGGAERQQLLIAHGLQQLGYKISFVTLDYGQPDGIEHNGIRVFKAYQSSRGTSLPCAFVPRWAKLNAALRRADAHIYHQMCADSETGQVAVWCRTHGRRFVFAAASDVDCQKRLPFLKTFRQRWLYRYGLSQAETVITQTISQRKQLERNFGINSIVIASCTNTPRCIPRASAEFPKSGRLTCVWVGRIVPLKRLEWLLNLAERCPTYSFLVVGGGDELDPYVRNIFARGAALPNVKMLGRISDRELWDVYERADLLLDTAAVAGVPTTFLEAWARGVPVISTINPDDIVTSHKLGWVVANVDEMASAMARLLQNPGLWSECSRAVRDYYERHHTVTAIGAAYHQLFTGLDPDSVSNAVPAQPRLDERTAPRSNRKLVS